MSKRKQAAPAPPPSPRQDSPTPPRVEGRGESHALPGVISSPPAGIPSEPFLDATLEKAGYRAPPLKSLDDALEQGGTYPCPDCTLEVVALAPSTHAKDCPRYALPDPFSAPLSSEGMCWCHAGASGHPGPHLDAEGKPIDLKATDVLESPTPPAPDDHARHDAEHRQMLEQAGAFGSLPDGVTAVPIPGTGHVVLHVEPQLDPASGGTALLATVDESGAPVVRDLLAEARLKDEADREAVLKQASDMHRHLTGSEGLSVRREPPEVGHPPRFTLLHVRVTEGGQASVKVLVPVAPWHLVEDAIRRFLRETLTPREYR